MTKTGPDCQAEVLSTNQPNRMGTTPEMQKMYDRFGGEEGKAKAALAYLIDHIVYSDSYGVDQSDFQACHLCQGGGAPHVPMIHDADCPVLKCEAVAEEWWQERHEDEMEELCDIIKAKDAQLFVVEQRLAALAATPAVGGERSDLIRRLRQHDGHLGLLVEEAADALAAQPASPLRGREIRSQGELHLEARKRYPQTNGTHREAFIEGARWVQSLSASTPEQPAADPVTESIGFIGAMDIVERGFIAWKNKPHNKKWFKRIDGTPIPNDLAVNIAEAIVAALSPNKETQA